MKKLISLVILLSCICISVFASYPNTPFQEFLNSPEYYDFYEILNNTDKKDQIATAYNSTCDYIDSLEFAESDKNICLAKMDLLIATYSIDNKTNIDSHDGMYYLENGSKKINKVENLNQNVDALIIESKLEGYYTEVNFLKYMWSKGLNAFNLINQVWDMDKENPRAILVKAQQLLYTPGFYGGDVKKGKSMIKDLMANESLLPEDAYGCIIDLAKMAKKENNQKLFDTYLGYSKSLFPNNYYLETLK